MSGLSTRAPALLQSGSIYLLRMLAVPLSPLRLYRVHSRPDAKPELRTFNASWGGPPSALKAISSPLASWRPSIGRSSAEAADVSRHLHVDVDQSGAIEFNLSVKKGPDGSQRLYASWFLGMVSNLLFAAHKFRCAANAPNLEYAIDVDLRVGVNELPLTGLGEQAGWDSLGTIHGGPHRFPRYSLGDADEMLLIARETFRDLANASGADFDVNIEIDFADQLQAAGLI